MTKLAQEYPDRWSSLHERHHAILQSAMDALEAAIVSQLNLQAEDRCETPIRVLMGIITGTAPVRNTPDHASGYKGYISK